MTAFMSTLQAVHGRAPDPPCGEFDVEAVDEDGARRRVPLGMWWPGIHFGVVSTSGPAATGMSISAW